MAAAVRAAVVVALVKVVVVAVVAAVAALASPVWAAALATRARLCCRRGWRAPSSSCAPPRPTTDFCRRCCAPPAG